MGSVSPRRIHPSLDYLPYRAASRRRRDTARGAGYGPTDNGHLSAHPSRAHRVILTYSEGSWSRGACSLPGPSEYLRMTFAGTGACRSVRDATWSPATAVASLAY